jgi:hypothetical protein
LRRLRILGDGVWIGDDAVELIERGGCVGDPMNWLEDDAFVADRAATYDVGSFVGKRPEPAAPPRRTTKLLIAPALRLRSMWRRESAFDKVGGAQN